MGQAAEGGKGLRRLPGRAGGAPATSPLRARSHSMRDSASHGFVRVLSSSLEHNFLRLDSFFLTLIPCKT